MRINSKLLREAGDNELEVLREIFALRRSGSCLTSQMKLSHDKNMEAIRKSFDRKDADTLYKARIKTSQVLVKSNVPLLDEVLEFLLEEIELNCAIAASRF